MLCCPREDLKLCALWEVLQEYGTPVGSVCIINSECILVVLVLIKALSPVCDFYGQKPKGISKGQSFSV